MCSYSVSDSASIQEDRCERKNSNRELIAKHRLFWRKLTQIFRHAGVCSKYAPPQPHSPFLEFHVAL